MTYIATIEYIALCHYLWLNDDSLPNLVCKQRVKSLETVMMDPTKLRKRLVAVLQPFSLKKGW